jgi:cytohesin
LLKETKKRGINMNDRQTTFIVVGAAIGALWGLIASLTKAGRPASPPARKTPAGGLWSKPGSLHASAEKDDKAAVEAQLAAGAATETRDQYGCTPLQIAAFKGHSSAVSALLAAGANANSRDNDGETPLHKAAPGNHTEVVLALLNAGAEKEVKDKKGGTPLHKASMTGALETVVALLNAGTNKDAILDELTLTPLQMAAITGKDKVVSVLLAAGANKEIRSKQGKTARDLAQAKGHTRVVRMLDGSMP